MGDVTNRINLTPVALMEATCFAVSGCSKNRLSSLSLTSSFLPFHIFNCRKLCLVASKLSLITEMFLVLFSRKSRNLNHLQLNGDVHIFLIKPSCMVCMLAHMLCSLQHNDCSFNQTKLHIFCLMVFFSMKHLWFTCHHRYLLVSASLCRFLVFVFFF